MRLPLVLISLAVIALLLSMALAMSLLAQQSQHVDRQARAAELSSTLEQITQLVESDDQWARNSAVASKLETLMTVGDEQSQELRNLSNGFLTSQASDNITNAAIAIDADWMTLRDSLHKALKPTQSVAQVLTPEVKASPVTPVQSLDNNWQELKPLVGALANDFELIRTHITEGTQRVELRALVNDASSQWSRINAMYNSASSAPEFLSSVELQSAYARDLLRLTRAGTSESLFGYRTTNMILSYESQVRDLERLGERLVEQLQIDRAPVMPVPVQTTNLSTVENVVINNPFFVEMLNQAKLTLKEFTTLLAAEGSSIASNLWRTITCLFIALLFSVLAAWRMMRSAKAAQKPEGKVQGASMGQAENVAAESPVMEKPANVRPEREQSTRERPVNERPTRARPAEITQASERFEASSVRSIRKEPIISEPGSATASGSIAARPVAASPVERASNEEVKTLLSDVNALAAGDLRHAVRVPKNGYGKPIAESINRSGAVMKNLVTMTRGVASRISELVTQHDSIGHALAQKDIQRQSHIAELSDSISANSKLLEQQQALLSEAGVIAAGIGKKSELAAGGVNDVSASLAAVSAQVEVGSGRMQRLLKTAGNVTESTRQLKQLAEQTRLQALNVSLKMTESEVATGEDYLSGLATDSIGLFDDVHSLTGKLVQISNDADTLIGGLQKEIIEAVESLTVCTQEINNSAQHTHQATTAGKELASQGAALQTGIQGALKCLLAQKDDLAQSAERIVALDKSGNDFSDLAMSLTQDVIELESMAAKLDDSVAGFKLAGDHKLE